MHTHVHAHLHIHAYTQSHIHIDTNKDKYSDIYTNEKWFSDLGSTIPYLPTAPSSMHTVHLLNVVSANIVVAAAVVVVVVVVVVDAMVPRFKPPLPWVWAFCGGRFGVVLQRQVDTAWGVAAGLPSRDVTEVYITCFKHTIMMLLRSSPQVSITPSVSVVSISSKLATIFPRTRPVGVRPLTLRLTVQYGECTCLVPAGSRLYSLVLNAARGFQEELFTTVVTLLGCCVQATVFGQFAHLIAALDGGATTFKRQISDMVDSMAYHDFPSSLKVWDNAIRALLLGRGRVRGGQIEGAL